MLTTSIKKYFGTDGIRGTANQFPMTSEIALKIGMALGAKFGSSKTNNDHRCRVIIGKDTRLSGYMIEPALTAGFVAMGLDVFLVGPVPTPAISMLTKSLRANIGIMISASHNPYHDNGIKIFNYEGYKLDDKFELEIEGMIESNLDKYLANSSNLGRVKRLEDAKGRYIEFVKNSFPKNKTLSNLKIVIDCANGASYNIAPTIYRELGAQVIEIGTQPNGFNINDKCGSTYPKFLQETVIKEKADIGIALDGDADRLVVVDENGEIIDGDILISLIAEKLHDQGKLKKDLVVITQMSNMALEEYLNYIGVSSIRTNIGDRYVLEEMQKQNCNFGGEQSGHLVLSDYSTTGDGIIASLQVLDILVSSKNKKISQLKNNFILNPQILLNVKLLSQNNILDNQEIQNFINNENLKLEKNERILIRKSGTENLIRIMVEGKNHNKIKEIANKIKEKIEFIDLQ